MFPQIKRVYYSLEKVTVINIITSRYGPDLRDTKKLEKEYFFWTDEIELRSIGVPPDPLSSLPVSVENSPVLLKRIQKPVQVQYTNSGRLSDRPSTH